MKIKAFQMNPETTDPEDYFDFDGWEDFIVEGGREFSDIHTDYNLYKRINDYCIEYNELQNAIADAGGDTSSVYPYYRSATEAIEDFLGFTPTKKQVHDIKAALAKADKDYPYTDFDDLTVKLLSICEKREWTSGELQGYCQGDCVTVFYPVERYSDEFVNYIESIYFNTGAEYRIVECNDNDSIPEEYDIDDLWATDGYHDYFQSDIVWNDDLLKKRIADDNGVKPEDVTLYTYEEVTTTIWHAA